jgi:uncharacterized protein
VSPDLFSRIEFGRLDATSVQRTPQGGLKIPAALTRTGVLVYRDKDGSVRREYRPADEVFKADSLASLEDAPVTDLHPTEMVNGKNFAALAKGHVRAVKPDGKLVAATTLVQEAELVAKVDRGERKEISCGYTCRLDMTPGVSPDGEAYDAIQRNITYNHVALLPVGAGRAGREVALRLDAAIQDQPTSEKVIIVTKIVLDGKEYVKGSDEHLAAVQAKNDADLAAARKDAADAKAATAKAEAERDQARKDAEAAAAPARKAAREKLEADARKVLGEDAKFDGKSDDQVREEAVIKGCPEIKLDAMSKEARPVYVAARFDALIAAAPEQSGSMANAARAANAAAGTHQTVTAKPSLGWVAPPLAVSRDK